MNKQVEKDRFSFALRGDGRFSVFNVHCVADTIIGVHIFSTKPLQSEQINLSLISAKIQSSLA
ncbi:hypothetical protein HpDR115_09650 [Helicobacter pylori]